MSFNHHNHAYVNESMIYLNQEKKVDKRPKNMKFFFLYTKLFYPKACAI